MTPKTHTVTAIALPIFVFTVMASAAVAQSFTGNWPVTISQSQRSNGTYCLLVTDDGSLRFPHSGTAYLTGPGITGQLFGTFQLINGLFTATIEQAGSSGQNAGIVFVARTTQNATIGTGIYDQVYGGEVLDSGRIVFGAKGGC